MTEEASVADFVYRMYSGNMFAIFSLHMGHNFIGWNIPVIANEKY